jgi:hypothetical protein
MLWNPEVHYHIDNSSPLVPFLIQTNPVPTTSSYIWKIHLSTHLCLGLPSGLFPASFPSSTLYAVLFSLIHATCATKLILLNQIILIILGEEYKSRRSSLCSFLHPPTTSSLFGPNIPLSTLFSNTLSLCFSISVRDQVLHSYRITGKIIVLYILLFKFLEY